MGRREYRNSGIRRDGLVDVFEVAVVLVVEHGDLGGKAIFDERSLDRRRDVGLLFVRHADADLGAEFAGRPRIAQQHRAACDVAPEQQALRPAQHLDTLQVEGVEHDAVGRADEHAVDEHADGRVDRRNRAVDALAAYREVLHARERADGLELHVRHLVAQVVELLDEQGVELRGAERRQRDRHFLGFLRFALLACGRDNLLEQRARGSLLRVRRSR